MSADLCATSGNCTLCNASVVFDQNASTTFQVVRNSTGQSSRLTTIFGDHVLTGDLVQDTVELPGLPEIQHQPWVLIDNASESYFGFGPGVAAMDFGFNTTETGVTPFRQSLIQANSLDAPEMGFWLDRPGADPAGFLTLGGRALGRYAGDVEFYPLAAQVGPTTKWLLNVSSTQLYNSSPLPYLRPFSCVSRSQESQ